MYRGQNILIPLGGGGLQTDIPQNRIAPTKLIEAENITLVNGYLEKSPGSKRWNQFNKNTGSTTVPNGIAAFAEFNPSSGNQRIIALANDGLVYKFNSPYVRVQVTPQTGAPSPLNMTRQPHITVAGNETATKARKVFIFSGLSQIQVIEGDNDTYRPIANPALDWASSYPTFGLVYRSRLWCFGNPNLPDFLYASEFANFENFTPSSPAKPTDFRFFDIFPGEGSGISGAFVFKNRLFVCKRPRGLFQLNDDDPNPDFWYFTRVNEDFGLASPHSIAQVFDDALMFNSQGTVTLLSAAFQLGDIESADLFNNSAVERYFRQLVSGYGLPDTKAMYYPDKKQVYFSIQSKSGDRADTIAVIDLFGKEGQIYINNKDDPNFFNLITDDSGISRPHYCSDDGNIYNIDSRNTLAKNYEAGPYIYDDYWEDIYTELSPLVGTVYEMVAQTPHMDFGFADPNVATRTKKFDFLELSFQPTGDWVVYADIYIDSEYKETIQFNLNRDRPLAPIVAPPSVINGFQLDVDRLDGDFPKSVRKPLHGQGRTISVKFRSNGYAQDIKLQSIMVYFRVSDERQIKDLRT
jgi:hypothetical protein